MNDTAPALGTPCWIDLGSSDREASLAFYTRLLGWDATAPNPDFGGYTNFLLDGRPVAGLMARQPEQTGPDAWSMYLATPDVAATLAAVAAAGGQIAMPAHPVADLGVMAFFIDPVGSMVGLWQPGTHLGFAPGRQVNGPMWFELAAADHEAAVAFYTAAFAQRPERAVDQPDMKYTTLAPLGEREGSAAIMTAPGVTAGWVPYVRVADVDASAREAETLGARVVDPPTDTPYGKMATVVDPTGARLKLMDPRTAG